MKKQNFTAMSFVLTLRRYRRTVGKYAGRGFSFLNMRRVRFTRLRSQSCLEVSTAVGLRGGPEGVMGFVPKAQVQDFGGLLKQERSKTHSGIRRCR